ncbi:DUF7225 domain-containing protein [Metabacillus fastidiosus]|uniref:DUF7225 domain-containing protein n=1 Tax=Metabacillus fastidiosus TaxID=1458 RepID=UPI002DB6471D|nr:hypothetical protein [Metabacillus fastidiosus]MEC2078080.1 hypothetical protein [Metabacillus fastidiosus]
MTLPIYEQVKEAMHGKTDDIIIPSEVKAYLTRKFGTNPGSIILSDYCYNRYNNGISFDKHLFEYINRNSYKYLGENYPYTGLIFHKPKGQDTEVVVGEWRNGEKIIYEKTPDNNPIEKISKEQIMKLYEDYYQILNHEMNLLNCKPTELRHLIGRIGEFICAIYTDGSLSRETNQHGFDVISKGRKISVKTTAQTAGFITINQNTFASFDDLFIVQYINDEFKIIYYGPKEEILSISRNYENKYEVDIKRLKAIVKNK